MKQSLLNLLALQMACWSVGAGGGNATSGLFHATHGRMDPGKSADDRPVISGYTLRPGNEIVAIVSAHTPIGRSDVSVITVTGSSSALSHSFAHANRGSMMAEPLLVGERPDTEPHRGDDASIRHVRHRKDREIPSSKKPRRRYMCVRPKSNRRMAHPTAGGRPHTGAGKKH